MTSTARRRVRRAATLVAGGILASLVTVGTGVAQTPPLPVDPGCVSDLVPCPTEDPSEEPTAEPTPEPSETPQPTPTPEPSSTPAGSGDPTPEPTASGPATLEEPSPEPAPVVVPDVGTTTPPDAGEPGAPAPEVAPPASGPDPARPGANAPTALSPLLYVSDPTLSSAMTGTLMIALMSALLGVGAFSGTYALTQRGLLAARTLEGGLDVKTTRRWRTSAGLVLFAVAAVVGIAGFTKIATETLVPIQMVYLASTGLAVILLAAVGGALLVSEQLRADEHRLTEIERALSVLAEHAAAGVADPPRLLDRGAPAEEPEPAPKPAAKRAARKRTAEA